MTQTIGTYTEVRENYNALVQVEFRLKEADPDVSGRAVNVLDAAPMHVRMAINHGFVETITIICDEIGDHAFDDVYIGFEHSLNISSSHFFEAYQEILAGADQSVGEAHGFKMENTRDGDRLTVVLSKVPV